MKIEAREWVKGKWISLDNNEDLINEAQKKAKSLLSEAEVVVFINIDESGVPIAKAMYPAYKNGISNIWFNTDATSMRFKQIMNNPIVTVYCYDNDKTEGIMLVGKAYVEKEHIWRERLWKKEFEEGYLGGLDDPDYQIIRFDTEWCNYFGQSKSITFLVAENCNEKTKL